MMVFTSRGYRTKTNPFLPQAWSDSFLNEPKLFQRNQYSEASIDQAFERLEMAIAVAHTHRDPKVTKFVEQAWRLAFAKRPAGAETDLLGRLQLALKPLGSRVRQLLESMGEFQAVSLFFGSASMLEAVTSTISGGQNRSGDMLASKTRFDTTKLLKVLGSTKLSYLEKVDMVNAVVQHNKIAHGRVDYPQFQAMVEAIEKPGKADAPADHDRGHPDGRNPWNLPKLYHPALRIIGDRPRIQFADHARALVLDFDSASDIGAFLSSMMQAFARVSHNQVLNFWHFKLQYGRPEMAVTSEDLRMALVALVGLRQYERARALYEDHPDLHDESHIDVLLQVAAGLKDWRQLQLLFEEMYGRGNLPYVRHYGLVMGSLAHLGVTSEVDKLYHQLLQRNLTPSTRVDASRIDARLSQGDLDGALQVLGERLKGSDTGYLYAKLMEYYIKTVDPDRVLHLAENAISDGILVPSAAIKVIRYFASSYLPGHLERFYGHWMRHARNLSHEKAEEVALAVADAYIFLGHYLGAAALLEGLHMALNPPFSLAPVFGAQLKLWRHDKAHHVTAKVFAIADAVSGSRGLVGPTISPKNRGRLYQELIRWQLNRGDHRGAMSTLSAARKHEVARESHYLPFMRFYQHMSHKKAYGGHQRVIDTYRSMCEHRVTMSTATYALLMRLVAFLDQKEGNFSNCHKLLVLIFEMNGISVVGDQFSGVLVALPAEMVNLCQVVSTFIDTSGRASSLRLLVNFLDFVSKQPIAGSVYDVRVKMVISQEMLAIYEGGAGGDRVVNNAMSALAKAVTRFQLSCRWLPEAGTGAPSSLPVSRAVPELLSRYYSSMVLAKRHTISVDEVLKIARQGVRIDGITLNDIFARVLARTAPLVTKDQLRGIMAIVEHQMVLGNYIDRRHLKHRQYLFKYAFAVAMARGEPPSRYEVLSRFYGVKPPHGPNRPSLATVTRAFLHEYAKVAPHMEEKPADGRYVLDHIGPWFNPEQTIDTPNKLSQKVVGLLWRALSQLHPTKEQLFPMMDEFPETVEYLLWARDMRHQFGSFRRAVDDMVAPVSPELYTLREKRTRLALKKLHRL